MWSDEMIRLCLNTNVHKNLYHLEVVEATDGDGCLSVRQPEDGGELVHTGSGWTLSSCLTPVNHSVQCRFHVTSSQTERDDDGEKEEEKKKKEKKTLRVRAPVPSLQQWECFPGRRLHWERETAQFTDGNSAIHHIICSWDPQGSEGRRRGAWWQMLQYVASTKQFS